MSSRRRGSAERRAHEDVLERGVWGSALTSAGDGAGFMMDVRTTDAVELQVPVYNTGYGFNLPANSDAEVLVLAMHSDPNNKLALPTIPRQFQHLWDAGTGGVQHPTDPERRVEFNDNETLLKDGTFVLGNNREVSLTIANGNVTLSINGGPLTLNADSIELTTPTLTNNGVNIGSTHTHTDTVGIGAGQTSGPA